MLARSGSVFAPIGPLRCKDCTAETVRAEARRWASQPKIFNQLSNNRLGIVILGRHIVCNLTRQ